MYFDFCAYRKQPYTIISVQNLKTYTESLLEGVIFLLKVEVTSISIVLTCSGTTKPSLKTMDLKCPRPLMSSLPWLRNYKTRPAPSRVIGAAPAANLLRSDEHARPRAQAGEAPGGCRAACGSRRTHGTRGVPSGPSRFLANCSAGKDTC